MCTRLSRVYEFRQDTARELLAQLHAPLIEAVDIPDDPLHEDLVLVQRNQAAQGMGCHLPEQEGIAGAVAIEDAIGQNARVRSLSPCLLRCFPVHQCLRLREEVGQQFDMMVTHRMVADGGCDEVAWNQSGPLVEQLEERMLSVGAGLSPDHGTCLVADPPTVPVHILAVAFHIPLLQIRGKSVQVLVVGKYGLGVRTEEIDVPDAQEGHDDGYVPVVRCTSEMQVCLVGAM